MLLSDLTYKIVAHAEVPNFNTNECVDWAIEMVALGYDTENLLILAGLSKPTNYFETVKYLNAAVNELGLKLRSGDDATISYSSYYILKIAKAVDVKQNLLNIYGCGIGTNIEKIVFDLCLLYWAWCDIDRGSAYTEYWPEANVRNIEQIVIDVANKWLMENEKYLSL